MAPYMPAYVVMIEPQRTTAPMTDRHGAKVMIVEDDADIATLVANVLAEEGYSTEIVTDSRQALDTFERAKPDVVTLDVMMPSLDGISLCLELRRNSEVPILFVSARKEPPDRVVGLRIGADDYMAKPFDTEELVARVDALIRRSTMSREGSNGRQIRFGRFVIDLGSVQAVAGEEQVQLTPTEFKLLRTLAGEPGRVFTRDDLLTGVRSEEHTSELQSRRDLVCRLLLEKKKELTLPLISVKKNKAYL